MVDFNNKFRKAFLKHKADKFHGHKYDRVYNLVLQDEPIDSVLEVGVTYGNSLRAWKEIWPNSIVEGIEIDEKNTKSVIEDHFKVFYNDSTKPIKELKNKHYDLIVDDGDHYWESQYKTFLQLYNKANKFYVIEDVLGDKGFNKLMEVLPDEAKEICECYYSVGYIKNRKKHELRYRILFFDKR